MDLGLKGKRAAIQASSTGIGFAIAKALSEEGAEVFLSSHNKENLEKAKKLIPGSHAHAIDLNAAGGGKEFALQAVRALGGVDILVTNAGGPPKGDFSDLSLADWDKGYLNLWRNVIESTLEVLPGMKKQRFGRIIFMTSTAAKEPISHLTISTSYRAGLLGLMKSLSREVAADQITVNSILPGYTLTKRMEEWKGGLDRLIADVPAGRLAEPWEIGALAAFLSSTKAAYLTGQAIACDGGLIRGV